MGRITALHRWIGLALSLVLILWTVTGLMFHLKPGWPGAYEMLDPVRRGSAIDIEAVQPPTAVAFRVREATGAGQPITRFELVDTALGPLYRVDLAGRAPVLVDARTGRVLSPLIVEDAVTLARDAASRSSHPDRYGEVTAQELGDDTVSITFDGGARVRVSRHDGSISQRGTDTDRIDRLYRLHYLQLSGNRTVDRVAAVVAIVATWALALLGIALFVGRLRSSRGR